MAAILDTVPRVRRNVDVEHLAVEAAQGPATPGRPAVAGKSLRAAVGDPYLEVLINNEFC